MLTMPFALPSLETLITTFDRSLRVLAGPAQARRPYPAAGLPPEVLSPAMRQQSAGLMRVNHTGEVCAQALYQGQALFARDVQTRRLLLDAAREEWDHLGWCQTRLSELGARPSLLNPLWYGGSFLMGISSALAGDRWNMAFLVETEQQVEQHLAGHLDALPREDTHSRAIVQVMREEEAAHAQTAQNHGAAQLPAPLRQAMRATAKVMTTGARWI